MITPSHFIYNWAAARVLDGKYGVSKARVYGMVWGGFLPDLPAYLFFIYYTFIAGASQMEMWGNLYFNSPFSPFITLSHSFLLWPLVALVGYLIGRKFMLWLGAGALLHSVMDFFVHNDDAYSHFWPLSDWKFMSPISYWDSTYYGNIVGTIDTVVILLLLVYLFQKMKTKRQQWWIVIVAVLYVFMSVAPPIFFAFN